MSPKLKTTPVGSGLENEDNLKNGDDTKDKDNPKNADEHKNGDDLKDKDDPKNEEKFQNGCCE